MPRTKYIRMRSCLRIGESRNVIFKEVLGCFLRNERIVRSLYIKYRIFL